jgi:ABC-type antimicrobial peptide transport system permease subunit
LLAYTTLKRIREIGIRLALGARPAQVRTMILSHGMQLLLVGATIGLVSAIALAKFLERLLFEANGANTEVYFGVGIVMLVATLLACWLPARRASRVDPIVALRQD